MKMTLQSSLIVSALYGKSTIHSRKEPHYNKGMKDKVELIADSEHIGDDVEDVFSELDEATKAKIVEMIETYIEVSIETVVENPEWFAEDEA